jgi:lipopolysaccharide export system ATP-binding protein
VFRGLTVWENLMALAELQPVPRSEQKERCERLMTEFHLQNVRNTLGMSLSGGERRRCEIARALVTSPSIMFLDEPFAGVDPKSVLEIQSLIAELNSRGIGVLITDHNVRETLQIANRAYILADGMIMRHGRPTEIAEDPDIRAIYLGERFRLD